MRLVTTSTRRDPALARDRADVVRLPAGAAGRISVPGSGRAPGVADAHRDSLARSPARASAGGGPARRSTRAPRPPPTEIRSRTARLRDDPRVRRHHSVDVRPDLDERRVQAGAEDRGAVVGAAAAEHRRLAARRRADEAADDGHFPGRGRAPRAAAPRAGAVVRRSPAAPGRSGRRSTSASRASTRTAGSPSRPGALATTTDGDELAVGEKVVAASAGNRLAAPRSPCAMRSSSSKKGPISADAAPRRGRRSRRDDRRRVALQSRRDAAARPAASPATAASERLDEPVRRLAHRGDDDDRAAPARAAPRSAATRSSAAASSTDVPPNFWTISREAPSRRRTPRSGPSAPAAPRIVLWPSAVNFQSRIEHGFRLADDGRHAAARVDVAPRLGPLRLARRRRRDAPARTEDPRRPRCRGIPPRRATTSSAAAVRAELDGNGFRVPVLDRHAVRHRRDREIAAGRSRSARELAQDLARLPLDLRAPPRECRGSRCRGCRATARPDSRRRRRPASS